jgi:MoaA/NifB/PqqE/SkfB family radical SAM enzyme
LRLLRGMSLKAMENVQSLGLPNLIQYLGGWSPFPVGVVLMLTLRCNLRCAMCLQASEREGGAPELSLAELEAVVDDLAASFRFKPFIHLTGGEPLLRRDTLALLAHVKERRFSASLTTNGLLLERHAAELVRLGLDRLHVSLDGPPEIHDAVRGVPGAHERAVAGIRAVVAARQELGEDRPAVTVNTVVSEANLAHLAAMIPIVQAAGADALSFQHLMFSSCTNLDQAPLDVDRLLTDIPRLQEQARAAGLPLTFFPRMSQARLRLYYQGREEDLKRKCVFPWYVVRVDWQGNVTPCRGFVAGNVKDQPGSFRQIWNGAHFRSFRRELARLGVFPDCGRCCHRQY